MKKTIISLMACLLFVSFSNAADPSSDRSKVEFFEKLYKTKIVGVSCLRSTLILISFIPP